MDDVLRVRNLEHGEELIAEIERLPHVEPSAGPNATLLERLAFEKLEHEIRALFFGRAVIENAHRSRRIEHVPELPLTNESSADLFAPAEMIVEDFDRDHPAVERRRAVDDSRPARTE